MSIFVFKKTYVLRMSLIFKLFPISQIIDVFLADFFLNGFIRMKTNLIHE